MKHVKRIVGFVLALVMVLALSVGAFAAGTNTITVKNAVGGQQYELYKILDFSVNENQTAYRSVQSVYYSCIYAFFPALLVIHHLTYQVQIKIPAALGKLPCRLIYYYFILILEYNIHISISSGRILWHHHIIKANARQFLLDGVF